MKTKVLFAGIIMIATAITNIHVYGQNVTFARHTVSISIADVIGIVDESNNQIDAFSEATAYNMGTVSFVYPDAASYQTTQTTGTGSFNVSASTPFRVDVRATASVFESGTVGETIPISVLSIGGAADAGITITPVEAGSLTTSYQPYATGGTGQVMNVAPTYTIPAEQAQANIFGMPDGTYSVDVMYQVSAQ